MYALRSAAFAFLPAWLAVTVFAVHSAAEAAQNGTPSADGLMQILVESPEPVERRHAIEQLAAVDAPADRIVPVLIQALEWDDNPAVRGRAAQALGNVRPVQPEVVPALLETLGWDDQLRVRWRIVEALERIGPVTEDVVPALVETLSADKSRGVRARAAEALGVMEPVEETVVPALTAALANDEARGVRLQASESLVKCAESLRRAKATTAIGPLRQAVGIMAAHDESAIRSGATLVNEALEDLERTLSD